MRPDELERRIRARLDALRPAPRAELLHVLRLPVFDRADAIGTSWGYPESRAFAELLIDCEEDRILRPHRRDPPEGLLTAEAPHPHALGPAGKEEGGTSTMRSVAYA